MNTWPLQRSTSRRVALAIVTTVGMAIVVGSAWLVTPAESSADSTLVSNLGQVVSPDGWERVGPSERVVYAQVQGFTTGSNEHGYLLSTVHAYTTDVGSDDDPKVSVYTSDDHGNPDQILHTLVNPTSFADQSLNTFSAPTDARLDADTGYFVVFENDVEGDSSAYYQVGFLDGNGQDQGGAAGWSLPTDQSYSVLVAVMGVAAKSADIGQGGQRSGTSGSADARSASAINHISNQIVDKYEDDHEWVRRTWRDYPLPVRVGKFKSPGFYVFSIRGLGGFKGVIRGIRYGFSEKGYKSKVVVLHELAHHFLLDHRVPETPEAVGVGWLYFNHRVKGDCPVGEIYADVLGYHTHRSATQSLGYLGNCPEIAKKAKPDEESVSVAGSVARGEIPQWFYDHYDLGDGTVDMDAVWADLRVVSDKRTAAYHLREMFGGYCSLREASWALGSSGPSSGNPWQDGGCHWRKPQDLTIVKRNGSLRVTWNRHLYETGPKVTHYVVQWRAADQTFDPSRRVLVPANSQLSHDISGLTDGTRYHLWVAAVNESSPTAHQDNDGHSRRVAASATPGKPGAVASLAMTPGDHEIGLAWAAPTTSEIELSGYRVEWKLKGEEFDASRRLDLSSPSTTSTVISGLNNGVYYTVRVLAISHDGTIGQPAWKTVKPVGPPEAPSNVSAVGGKNSLLVSWEFPENGAVADGFVLQWRTRATYEPGNEVISWGRWKASKLLEDMAGHGRYYVRVLARNSLGRSEPSEEYFVMSGAPGKPTDVAAEVRPGGGFTVTWDRPNPYYPNIPDFRPVRNFSTKRPIRDADGDTVPQYRYDIEYKLADGQGGSWCSLEAYRDVGLGNDTLRSDVLTLNVKSYCEDAAPIVGERYNLRVRAAYVWKNSGNTNVRNGQWAYSGPIVYDLRGGPPESPTGIQAAGGRDSLLVWWEPPADGGTVGGYIVEWRTKNTYKAGDQAVVDDPAAVSHLLEDMAGHGRYYIRVKTFNLHGESAPSDDYFVMSGAPGKPMDVAAEVRPGGGFTVTWDRPNPYYPNNPDFKPVRSSSSSPPILDDDGKTVPQFRYDVEFKKPDGQSGGWCSLSEYRDIHRGYNTLDPAAHTLDYTSFCQGNEPVVGDTYRFRIRAAYVWHSNDTNKRNGPWAYSRPIVYDPPAYNQN